jgi:hypothetical protein
MMCSYLAYFKNCFVIAAILNAAWIKGSDPATLVFIGVSL